MFKIKMNNVGILEKVRVREIKAKLCISKAFYMTYIKISSFDFEIFEKSNFFNFVFILFSRYNKRYRKIINTL